MGNNIVDNENFTSFDDLIHQKVPQSKIEKLENFISSFSTENAAKKHAKIACLDNNRDNDDKLVDFEGKVDKNFVEKVGLNWSLNEFVFEIVKEALVMAKAPSYVITCSHFFHANIGGVSFVRYLNLDASGLKAGLVEYCRSQLCYCHNIWLCPRCRRFIFLERVKEIAKAFKHWKDDGYKVYMLTLTAQHTRDTRAVDLVPQIKRAYTLFRKSRVFSEIFKDNSPTGGQSVIGNYEFTFGKGGIHPHRHLLLFVKSDIMSYKDRLLNEWVRACGKVDIVSNIKALDLKEIHVHGDYIAKISYEMADSGFNKECRDTISKERLNYFQLCYMVYNEFEWAKYQLKDYVRACKGLRALHWSKGLKAYFKVDEQSDEYILTKHNKIVLAWISKTSAYSLNIDQLDYLLLELNRLGGNIHSDEFRLLCDNFSLDLYDDKLKLIHNFGVDGRNDIQLIQEQYSRDYILGDIKYSELTDIERKELL